LGKKFNESDKTDTPEEMEDKALKNVGKKKKARLRTRGPYRQASTKNLPLQTQRLRTQKKSIA
jgi:hypothetical protein